MCVCVLAVPLDLEDSRAQRFGPSSPPSSCQCSVVEQPWIIASLLTAGLARALLYVPFDVCFRVKNRLLLQL